MVTVNDADKPAPKRVTQALRWLLPVLVLVAAFLLASVIRRHAPEPDVQAAPQRIIQVEVMSVTPSHYPVMIRSQGTVQPTLSNTLVPAVAGTVIEMADSFVVGGAFSKGDTLLRIDPRDYVIALTQAEASYAQSQAQLFEQQALADQARAEWRSMGRSGQPSALTLREPQLAAAEANLAAAAAQTERARLDLERTEVIAPYDGIVTQRQADLGQFVARGAPVGTIHSRHALDVRLPISRRQLPYLTLPESLPSPQPEQQPESARLPAVTLSTRGQTATWQGTLVRVEGIDNATRQLMVVARVQAPLRQSDTPLRVGEFVQAVIEGDVLEAVFVIPRRALREEREVLVVDAEQTLQRRSISVAWSDESVAVVDAGLNTGDNVVLTPLSTVADGTPVEPIVILSRDGVVSEPATPTGDH